MKQCSRCKKENDFSKSQFEKSGGICKICNNLLCKEYKDKNKDKIKTYQKNYDAEYYIQNKNKILDRKKELYAINPKIIQDKHRRNSYQKNKRKTNISFRLRSNISANINFYLKLNKSSKHGESILKHLPYTINDLKNHLQSKFESWMTWENYGNYKVNSWNDQDISTWKWNIDHIIPHSTFKYISMEEKSFKDCWCLENLRPYSAKQNLIDGATRMRHLDNSL